MGNQGNYNGNNSSGRRNIGSSNQRPSNNYGVPGNNYNNASGNKYAKYGGSGQSMGTYNSPNNANNLNGHNSSQHGNKYANKYSNNMNAGNAINNGMNNGMNGGRSNVNNQYQDILGLEGNYEDIELQMDEASLEDIAAAKKADRKAKIKLGIKIGCISILAIVLIVGIVVYVKYGAEIMDLRNQAIKEVQATDKDIFTKSNSSKYYAKQNGQWVQIEFAASTPYKYLSIKDGGANMQYACDIMNCSEDRNFYEHSGVDYMANIKAVILLVVNRGEIERGGSTITQQLARNVILLDFDQTWRRKVKEIFVSWELEKKFSKDEIMEFYLNNINFSNGYFGIETAARGYFGKSVKDLTKSQVAFLCSIPNNPTRYNPYEHMDRTIKRSKMLSEQVLKYGEGKLEKAEYTSIVAEADTIQVIPEDTATASTEGKTVKVDSMLKKFIRQSAIEKIISTYMDIKSEAELTDPDFRASYQANYEMCREKAETRLDKEGLHIYTTLDLDLQKSLQSNIDTKVKGFAGGKTLKKDKTYKMQSAGVCIDNKTGCIVAMVNSRSMDVVNSLPRAYGNPSRKQDGKLIASNYANQPGSAIKPLLVYGPAFDKRDEATGKAIFTNYSTRDDSGPVDREGSSPVKNSSDVYMGPNISILEAIKGSSNVVAYSLYNEMFSENRKYAMNYLTKMNFSFLEDDDWTHATTSIGGFAYGTTPLEMSAAYATIANDGEYRKPTIILTFEENTAANPLKFDESKVAGPITKSVKIYEQSTARRLTIAMQEVLRDRSIGGYYSGTARKSALSIDCAGKTGTTNGKADAWFCGFTQAYTTAIWVGDDDNGKTSITGASVASVWKSFNNDIIKKKRLTAENCKFNLVIMDDSEPPMMTVMPTDTFWDPFATVDPGQLFPTTDPWGPTTETTYTYQPFPTEGPISSEPWPTQETVTLTPTQDPGPGNGNENGNGNGPGNGNEGNQGNNFGGFFGN